MADPTPKAFIRSAQGHVEMYEASIARRKEDLANNSHVIDEASTRAWLALDEAELATWERTFRATEFAAKQEAG